MNKTLSAIALSLALAAPVSAAEYKGVTCATSWNGRSDAIQTATIVGWLSAIETADQLTNDEILSKLWPSGHRVGSVVIEVDIACERRENRERLLGAVISEIARRLNGVAEPKPQPYTQF
jgi:hypothetical protein